MQFFDNIFVLFAVYVQASFAFVLNSQKENIPQSVSKTSDNNNRYFLWRVKNNFSTESYLFGTIHVPYIKLWDAIPRNMMEAFNTTQELYLELDMSEETLSSLVTCAQLPNHQTVQDILSPELYLRFKSHLNFLYGKISSWVTARQKKYGLSATLIFNWLFENWETRRPIWTLLKMQMVIENYVTSIEYLQLDTYLGEIGRRFGKVVGGIENVEDTCGIINNLNESQVLFLLNKTMEVDKEVLLGLSTRDLNNLIQLYRNGTISPAYFSQKFGFFPQLENNEIGSYIYSDEERKMAEEIHSYLRHHIIFERNKVMTERIKNLIINNLQTSYFFAFGVGHFIGNNSIVDMLKQSNVIVEQIPPDIEIGNDLQNTTPKSESQEEQDCSCDGYEAFEWFICVVHCAFGL